LLKEGEKASGGQPFQKKATSRIQTAIKAGLSKDQAVNAVRVANIAPEAFQALRHGLNPSDTA
jgi:hypothetical protein